MGKKNDILLLNEKIKTFITDECINRENDPNDTHICHCIEIFRELEKLGIISYSDYRILR